MNKWKCPDCGESVSELTLAQDVTQYRTVRVTENGPFCPISSASYKLLARDDNSIRDEDIGNERIFCDCGYYLPNFELTED